MTQLDQIQSAEKLQDELLNEGLKGGFNDISNELSRKYIFPDGSELEVEWPVCLMVKKSPPNVYGIDATKSHRVVGIVFDPDGIPIPQAHYIEWQHGTRIEWTTAEKFPFWL